MGSAKGCNSGAFSCIDNLASLVVHCPSPVCVLEMIAPLQLPVWVLKKRIRRIMTVTIWNTVETSSNGVNDRDAICSWMRMLEQFIWPQ